MSKGEGQYDLEYANCSCFWGLQPAKFVKLLASELHVDTGAVLDLGAGEGKNTIFMASLGFRVVAVECSQPAIQNFRRVLERTPADVVSRIEIIQANVLNFVTAEVFDAVIAYGLLHCLPSRAAVWRTVASMQAFTRNGGYNAVATFTDDRPVPAVQNYLEPTLLHTGELQQAYGEWEIVASEDAVLVESHPTSKDTHEHSITRLLARKRQ